MAKINPDFNKEKFDRDREARSWRLWEFLNVILRFFTFRPWKAFTMRKKIIQTLDDEAPLVGLDRLATEGLVAEELLKISDLKVYPQILEMARLVCESDGEVSAEEVEFVENYINEILPASVEQSKRDEIMEFFKTIDVSTINFRNTCHAIKSNLSHSQQHQFLNEIYRLAYLHDLDAKERRLVDDIGQRIGLGATDIRTSAFSARQERGKQIGKPVVVDIPKPPQITLDEDDE
ncbi:MAG: hypothetical protein HN590_03015 [Calditrichaeota bacterium]|nr:hypothetical protein [Calditrichota bacterium]